jgi:hypothetical protein
MATSRRTAVIASLLLMALAAFTAASLLFAVQGGFGRGHERFDQAIGLLGLPWMAILAVIPWTESLWVSDYVMIVLLPLACNLTVVFVLWVVLKRRR